MAKENYMANLTKDDVINSCREVHDCYYFYKATGMSDADIAQVLYDLGEISYIERDVLKKA